MTGDQDDTHDALRARLRAADPASSLEPADPEGLARLLEATMLDENTIESRTDGTQDRSRLTWLVAAAAVVLIAGGASFFFLDGRGDDPTIAGGDVEQTAPADVPSSASQTVTELTVGAAPSARCVVPTPEIVGQQDLAFDGVVQSISAGVVTLEPSTFYAGEATDLVTVRAPDQDLQKLLVAVDFDEGGRYLVAATDGRVAVCMISTAWSQQAQRLYEQAFAG